MDIYRENHFFFLPLPLTKGLTSKMQHRQDVGVGGRDVAGTRGQREGKGHSSPLPNHPRGHLLPVQGEPTQRVGGGEKNTFLSSPTSNLENKPHGHYWYCRRQEKSVSSFYCSMIFISRDRTQRAKRPVVCRGAQSSLYFLENAGMSSVSWALSLGE